jgi:hypothetical protein
VAAAARAAGDGPPIEVVGLSKGYHGRPAVDAIDLTVLSGEVYGFLGPNGATWPSRCRCSSSSPRVSTAFALPPLIAAMVIFSRRDVAT